MQVPGRYKGDKVCQIGYQVLRRQLYAHTYCLDPHGMIIVNILRLRKW